MPRLHFDEAVTPPIGTWELTPPADAGWDVAALETAAGIAEGMDSTALMVVYQGRLILDRQWDPAATMAPGDRRTDLIQRTRTTSTGERHVEDVTSVAKGVLGLLVVMAEEQGLLSMMDKATRHAGPGWSKALPKVESRVTIEHLLSMTSGLVQNGRIMHPPGSSFRYTPEAALVIQKVLEGATGLDAQTLLDEWLGRPLGLSESRWEPATSVPGGSTLTSSASDLARIGVLVAGRGAWGEGHLVEAMRIDEMLRPSQAFNPAFARFWFLNAEGALLSGGVVLEGRALPSAPADMVTAFGRPQVALMVSPEEQIVIVRLGATSPTGTLVELDRIWRAVMSSRPHDPMEEPVDGR